MKYFEVKAKCGHMRMSNYIVKNLYIYALDGKEAAKKARKTPRVKHDKKDAILYVKEISYEEYIKGLDAMKNDMYFLVHNSSDQKRYCTFNENEILKEPETQFYRKPTHARRKLAFNARLKEFKRGEFGLYE